MSTLVSASARAQAAVSEAHRTFSFSFVLNSEPSDDDAERIYARCSDVTLGVRSGVPYAAFDRAARSLPDAVEGALRDIEQASPELTVTRVATDELVNAADIARRTSRTRASVSQLVEGSRGPGNFPAPRASLGERPLWDWLDVASWFATNRQSDMSRLGPAVFLSAVNAALSLRRVVPQLKGEAEKRTLAKLIPSDVVLPGHGRERAAAPASGRTSVKTKMAPTSKRPGAVATQRVVAPHPHGGWTVTVPGAKRASLRAPTKREAETRAKEIVRRLGGGRVLIHGLDGRVLELEALPTERTPGAVSRARRR